MVFAGASLVVLATLVGAPPDDGRIVRLGVGFPEGLPAPVQEDITAAVDRALAGAGLEVVAVDTVCTDPECYKQALSDAGASLGMQVLVGTQGPDYQLTTSFFDASGEVVASDGEACDICRHDEVVARTTTLVSRTAQAFRTPDPPAQVSVVSSPSGAAVKIDGQPVGTTPYEGQLPEGTHTIAVERSGYAPMERSVEGTPGAQLDEAFTLERTTKFTPKAEVIVGATALGLGLAAIGAGIALIVIDENDIENDCSGDNVDANGVCKYRWNTLPGGAAAAAVGAVGVGVGIGLIVHGRKRAGRTTEVTIVPGGLRGRF